MSWTYSANPAGVPRDAFRLYLGDTDSSDPMFQDTEVDYFLGIGGSPLGAAIQACTSLIARAARRVTESVGEESIQYGQLLSNYQALLSDLKGRMLVDSVQPYAGGISRADECANDLNTDLVRPIFGNLRRSRYGVAESDIYEDDCLLFNLE